MTTDLLQRSREEHGDLRTSHQPPKLLQNEARIVQSDLSTWETHASSQAVSPCPGVLKEGIHTQRDDSCRLWMPEITSAAEDSLYTTTLTPEDTVQRPQGPGIESLVARGHEWQELGSELKQLPCTMCLA